MHSWIGKKIYGAMTSDDSEKISFFEFISRKFVSYFSTNVTLFNGTVLETDGRAYVLIQTNSLEEHRKLLSLSTADILEDPKVIFILNFLENLRQKFCSTTRYHYS